MPARAAPSVAMIEPRPQRTDVGSCPALVFGSGVTQLGVLRALARSGISAFAVSDREDFVRHSRWYRAAPRQAAGASLASYLGGLTLPRGVLIPCSDSWVSAIAGLEPGLGDRFPACVPSAVVAEMLVDKLRFAEVLRAIGVPHPHTEMISSVADLERVPEAVLAGTTFLKPRDSQRFFARFNAKAFRVASRADAVARLREIEAAGLSVVLQEYVPGPASNHYYVEGFIDAHGDVRIRFARRRLRMYPPDFGNSTYFVSVDLDEVRGAVASMDTLLASVHYRGIFSAEFKRDDRDGEFKLLDVNARPWWYVDFAVRSGADVVTASYRDALGLPVATAVRYRVGATCMYPYYDYYASRGDRWTGRRFAAWMAALAKAQQPVFTWADPMPGLTLASGLARGWTRKVFGTGRTH
jgi:D-aspartate ligase